MFNALHVVDNEEWTIFFSFSLYFYNSFCSVLFNVINNLDQK